jgi:hypothetical protein
VRLGILPLDRSISITPQNGFQIYDSTTVVEISAARSSSPSSRPTYYGGVLDQLWHDAVTGRDLDQVLADAIASLR